MFSKKWLLLHLSLCYNISNEVITLKKDKKTKNEFELYIHDLKDDLELINDKFDTKDDYNIVNVHTIKTPDEKIKYKKNGTSSNYYKDIPWEGHKIKLHVLHQKFWSFDDNETIKIPMDCVVPSHKITKRLASYSLNLLGERSYKETSDITGIKSRTLEYLVNDWALRTNLNADVTTLYIFQIDTNKGHRYVVLDSVLNSMMVTPNKYEIPNGLGMRNINKIIVSMDLDIIIDLIKETEAEIAVDYFDFQDFVIKSVFKEYKRIRNLKLMKSKRRKTDSAFTTSLSDELELFCLPKKLMSDSQKKKFDEITDKNKDFNDFFEIKELLLEEAKEPLTAVNKADIQSSLRFQVYDNVETNFPIRPNKVCTNPSILKLFGLQSLLRLYNIGFDYSKELYEIKDVKQKDYNEVKEKLSDKQLMLRWNTSKTY